VIHKRDPHAQSSTERARVAAELMTEAEQLTKTVGMATPAEVTREQLPPPLAPMVEPESNPPPAAAVEPPVAPRSRPVTPTQNEFPVRYETARADLERLLQAEPGNVSAHLELAALLAKRGLRAEGLPYLRRAVELEPQRVTVWHQLGELLNRLDDLAGAKDAFEHAIALDARHARSLYGLAIVLDRMNRPDEATFLYRRSRDAAGGGFRASNGGPPGASATP